MHQNNSKAKSLFTICHDGVFIEKRVTFGLPMALGFPHDSSNSYFVLLSYISIHNKTS